MGLSGLKRLLIGRPIETAQEKNERLNKKMGLAVFSSDALSSVAYGPEEVIVALSVGGLALLHFSVPVAIAISTLVIIVAISYFQTIHAYPAGGGAYIVAKDNLGKYPGLVAGAALLIDYVLTVAVSISAGIAAITSAFPSLHEHRVFLCLVSIIFIMTINLRGVKESGKVFAVPVYLFIGCMYVVVGYGLYLYLSSPSLPAPAVVPKPEMVDYFIPFVLLRSFASGCATLTGIEAVSNGVRAFKPPEAKNAGITLLIMAMILATLCTGLMVVAYHFRVTPSASETLLSQISGMLFSKGIFYYIIQFATSLILILAVNTSFAGFPMLSSIMAADRFLPRQLTNVGDRLVFTNGILALGLLASGLVVIYQGDTHKLIPLYAVGVFLAFTLSQTGMVRHWLKLKSAGWRRNIVINGIGAVATGVVLAVIVTTKFTHGAWMVVVAIPMLVYGAIRIEKHYQSVAEQLAVPVYYQPVEFKHHSVIVPISGVQTAVLNSIKYAKALSDDVVAVYVSLNTKDEARVREDWAIYGMGVPLVVLDSPYRSVTRPLIDYVDKVKEQYKDGVITVLMPEFVPAKLWQHALHNQTALVIRGLLHFKPGVVTIAVPLHLKPDSKPPSDGLA
jgi:amino acid transporter